MFHRYSVAVIAVLAFVSFMALVEAQETTTANPYNDSTIERILDQVTGLLKSLFNGQVTLGSILMAVFTILQLLLEPLLPNLLI